jgi:hypothetical protein
MTAWSPDELDAIGGAREVDIAPLDRDGTPGQPVTIWIVRVGDDLYIRSWRGVRARWFRAAQRAGAGRLHAAGINGDVTFATTRADLEGAVDGAYLTKYGGRGAQYVEDMIAPEARATTLKLVPRQ